MTTLIAAEDVQKSYTVSRGMFAPPAELRAVNGASFTVETGETLAVVGESGCGKSTLARLVTMIETPTGGALTIDGHDVASNDRETLKRLRATVQIVFQNPYGALNPRQKIGAVLMEPLDINTDLSYGAKRKRALEMLELVGLRPEHFGRYPHMFSGGQRQRIAVARALMLEPKILVLDEPVSALDVSIQAQILNLLADLQERLGLTYLFISHDLSVVRHVADRVMVMYLGRPVEQAPSEEIFARPRHPYTRALLSATPSADPKRRGERIRLTGEPPSPFAPPSGCVFHPRCGFATERCRAETPEALPAGEAMVACHAVEAGRIPAGAVDATQG